MVTPKKLGPQEAGALAYWGGDLVTSLPANLAALLKPHAGVELPRFAALLQDQLEIYRATTQARADQPPRAAVVTWLQDAASNVDAAARDGKLLAMPLLAEAAAFHAASRQGLNVPDLVELIRRADAGAAALLKSILLAAADTIASESRRGRRSERPRDQLQACLVAALRAMPNGNGGTSMSSQDAHTLVEEILRLCGVPVSPSNMQRATRRGRAI